MKKYLLIPLVLLLVLTCTFGCKQTTTDNGYYYYFSSAIAPNTATAVDLSGYTFSEFLNRHCIAVSTTEGEATFYGVVNGDSGKVIITPTCDEVEMYGDFFLLNCSETNNNYQVKSLDGTLIFESQNRPEISDIGGGYVSITVGDVSSVYNSKGEEMIAGSLMNGDYEYSACSNFLIARSTKVGDCHIFNLHTGELKKSFYPKNETLFTVHYAGGNDFIVIYDYYIEEGGDYDILLREAGGSEVRLKQSISRFTIGVDTPHTIPFTGYIASVRSRYAFDMTQEERENYPLQEEYFSIGTYNVTNKTADGKVTYFVTDRRLNKLVEMPNGIRPDTKCTDGYFMSGLQSNKVMLFDSKLNPILTLPEERYYSATLSDGAIVATILSDKRAAYGAYDLEGNVIIEFKYSYLSAFISGKAIGVHDGKSYLVSKSGEEEYIGENKNPFYWDGYYVRTENERIGLTSYNKTTLTSATYDSVQDYKRFGDTVYVALQTENVTIVYKLT